MPAAKKPPETLKVWQVSVNGSAKVIQDLDARRLQQIAKTNGLESWSEILVNPLPDLGVAMDLYELAAESLGLEAPPLSVRQIVEAFELVDEPEVI